MSEQTCDNCGRFKRLPEFPTAGDCPVQGSVSAYNYCPQWLTLAKKHLIVPAEAQPMALDFGELEIAADKVLAMDEPINIVMAQRRLRCSYSVAAEVVEYLQSTGRIK